jgi:fused signal recognition particle receptor
MIQTLFGPPPDPGLLDRFKTAVTKTRDDLTDQLDDLVQGKKEIDADLLDELEMMLIGADIGVRTATEVLDEVRESLDRKQLKDPAELKDHIARRLLDVLNAAEPKERPAVKPPEVILVVGVNGTGKTTTIGKLAHRLSGEGKKVLLCAADTFRAAAAEQLTIWGERTGQPVIKQKPGSDPSAVIFDALEAAKARAVDYVIVDTAGRLHNKAGLMAELEKMKRTAGRLLPGPPVHRNRRRHRPRPHETRRHRQGRHRRRDFPRTRPAHPLRWSWRTGRRPDAIRRRDIRSFAL